MFGSESSVRLEPQTTIELPPFCDARAGTCLEGTLAQPTCFQSYMQVVICSQGVPSKAFNQSIDDGKGFLPIYKMMKGH